MEVRAARVEAADQGSAAVALVVEALVVAALARAFAFVSAFSWREAVAALESAMNPSN